MRKLEELEKVVIQPSVDFYGGFKYDGEDIFLCDDFEETEERSIRITQSIRKGKLISHITKQYKLRNEKKVVEEVHKETELDEGQLLVYVKDKGFVIPEYMMCSVDEAIEQYKLLK